MDTVTEVLSYSAWIAIIVAPYVIGGAVFGALTHRHKGSGKGLLLAVLTGIGAWIVVHEAAEGGSWWMLLALLPIVIPEHHG